MSVHIDLFKFCLLCFQVALCASMGIPIDADSAGALNVSTKNANIYATTSLLTKASVCTKHWLTVISFCLFYNRVVQ